MREDTKDMPKNKEKAGNEEKKSESKEKDNGYEIRNYTI